MSQLLQIAVASRRSPSQEWRSPETVIAVTVAAASGYFSGLSKASLDRSYIGLVLHSCNHLNNIISGCVICYVRRNSNRPAHLLAKADGARVIRTL
nr:uncharacterized protein LOC109147027 [Ipomoea batatas]